MVGLPLPTAYGKGHSHAFDATELVNWYARKTNNTGQSRVPYYLEPRPGTVSFIKFENVRIRGLYGYSGLLYVVAGNTLYSVDQAGLSTSRGTIGGFGSVFMTDNGKEVGIVSETGLYIYDVPGTALREASLPDGQKPSFLISQNGYGFTGVKGDTRFYRSDDQDFGRNQDLNFEKANSDPDKLISALNSVGTIDLYGETSTEIWYNSGQGSFFYERVPDGVLDVGIAAPMARCRFDNAPVWLGHDRMLYRREGLNPRVISTDAFYDQIQGLDVSDASFFSFPHGNRRFMVAAFPAGRRTFVIDAATSALVEWTTGDREFLGHIHASVWNRHFVARTDSGEIHEIKRDSLTDSGIPIVRKMRLTVAPQAGTFTIDKVEFIFDAGNGGNQTIPEYLLDADGSVLLDADGNPLLGADEYSEPTLEPIVSLRWSDDNGITWSAPAHAGNGYKGQHRTRCVFNRLGQFTNEAVLEVTVSAPLVWRLVAADAIIKAGSK